MENKKIEIQKIVDEFVPPQNTTPFLVAYNAPVINRKKLNEWLNNYLNNSDYEVNCSIIETSGSPMKATLIFSTPDEIMFEKMITAMPAFKQKLIKRNWIKIADTLSWIDTDRKIREIDTFPILEVETNDNTSLISISNQLSKQVRELWKKEYMKTLAPFSIVKGNEINHKNTTELIIEFPQPTNSSYELSQYRIDLISFYRLIERSLNEPSKELEKELSLATNLTKKSCSGKTLKGANNIKEISKINTPLFLPKK